MDNIPEEEKKKIIDRLCIKFRHQGYEEIKKLCETVDWNENVAKDKLNAMPKKEQKQKPINTNTKEVDSSKKKSKGSSDKKEKVSPEKRMNAVKKILALINFLKNNDRTDKDFSIKKYVSILNKLEEKLNTDPVISSKEIIKIKSELDEVQYLIAWDYVDFVYH